MPSFDLHIHRQKPWYTGYWICFFLLIHFSAVGNAQSPTANDSVIFFLRQAVHSQDDTIQLAEVVRLMNNEPADHFDYERLFTELEQLRPGLKPNLYYYFRTVICQSSAHTTHYAQAIQYCKALIDELRQNPAQYARDLIPTVLADIRFPFRNSRFIYDGIRYIQQLANEYESKNANDIVTTCYYDLSGFYRTLGLTDKSIYFNQKSASYLDSSYGGGSGYSGLEKYNNLGINGIFNRKVVIGGMLNDANEPQRALLYLNEVRQIYEGWKDKIEISDVPYMYLQLARAKLRLKQDSVLYYLLMVWNNIDQEKDHIYSAMFCQEMANYFNSVHQTDSALHYIRQAATLQTRHQITYNTFSGYLIPGFYEAQIHVAQKNYPAAIQCLINESRELLKFNMRRILLQEYLLLSAAYKQIGNKSDALNTLERYNDLLQQVLHDESKSRALSFEAEQEISRLNVVRQRQQAEITRQKFARNAALTGLLFFLLFSVIFLFQRNRIAREKKRSDELLLNILPEEVAEELKARGAAEARQIDEVTVLFTDFKGFTQLSEKMTPKELVSEINTFFMAFDDFMQQYGVEKIKTIGDSYMAAGGLPVPNATHAVDVVKAALAIQEFMQRHKAEREAAGKLFFEIRIGIHTGPVVAGIVGVKKFAYDIWGDTVNTASRMESSGEAGKINISGTTYALVKDQFDCTHRGKITAKGKGEIDMYFVRHSLGEGELRQP